MYFVETDLFDPVDLGPLRLSNRIVMAPLTRCRGATGDIPGPLAPLYYGQRAAAGLIISEASQVSPQGKGYAGNLGIYSAEQIVGWKAVARAVHERGGRMFLQLWHGGRISHPDLQPGGALPVAPSAIRPDIQTMTKCGPKAAVIPRALDIGEFPGLIEDFRRAAENARAAGFDGVEIHAANGYLLDQFLRDGANRREDAYGGAIENRVRLTIEVAEAVAAVWGPERVGIRISPINSRNDLTDSNPEPLYLHLVDRLNDLSLAYMHVIEGETGGPREVPRGFDLGKLRRRFKGLTILNNGYDRELALEARRQNRGDLICFGRPFISNPDLVERLRRGLPLTPPDSATFYGGGAEGYVDYPCVAAE